MSSAEQDSICSCLLDLSEQTMITEAAKIGDKASF